MEIDWSKFCAFNGLFDGNFLKTSSYLDNVNEVSRHIFMKSLVC